MNVTRDGTSLHVYTILPGTLPQGLADPEGSGLLGPSCRDVYGRGGPNVCAAILTNGCFTAQQPALWTAAMGAERILPYRKF